MVLALAWPSSVSGADEVPDWESTPLTGKASHLFTPASGALFAQIDNDLDRSDDAGTTWTLVSLPPANGRWTGGFGRRIAIDSTNHDVLYANGTDGLYRTQDGGANWDLVLPTAPIIWHLYQSPDGHVSDHVDVIGVAITPADSTLLYVGLRNADYQFQFLRSRDSGQTWERLEETDYDLCTWGISVLQPHPPADPEAPLSYCRLHGRSQLQCAARRKQ